MNKISSKVNIPIIASGGVGTLDHLVEGINSGASAVLALPYFNYGTFSVKETQAIFGFKGIPVRFEMLKILEDLVLLARERKKILEGSYTNKLLTDKNLSKDKVIEEINELIEAVSQNSNKIHEAADVMYHLIIYLEANNVKIEDVMTELSARKK